MLTNDEQIDSCLENICNQGCQVVNQIIYQIEHEQIIDIIEHLTIKQKIVLLQELKDIMIVYSGSCTYHER
ncbi:MAG TPA: hypothetical protein ENK59_00340 [Thioploca sp.]|nr:hypothetical protein [Thioploca sp.]